MDFWTFFWTIYAIVAGLSMNLTYREQLQKGHRILAYRAAGLLACAAWPLVFPLVLLSAQSRGV